MTDDILLRLIIEHALKGRDHRPLSRGGNPIDWLLDLRAVFLRPDCLRCIAAKFWDLFGDAMPLQIAGLETAAIPLVTALILGAPEHRSAVTGAFIRKERKPHGMGKLIEGQLDGLPVILVDDAINSGSSAEKARASIEAAGGRVTALFVVVDFKSHKGMAWRERHGITVSSLFTLADLGLSLRANPPPLPQQYALGWRREVSGGNPFHVVPKSAPVLRDGRIFRGCDAAAMQCFDAETGAVRWTFQVHGAGPTKGIWSTPALHEGRLYFGAYDGGFYCLDAATGEEIWSQPLCEWIGASPLIVARHGLVYVGLEYERPWCQGSLTALDLSTGERVWEHRTARMQHGSAAYFAGGDLVIWGSADHETLGLRAATGEIVWRLPTERSVKYAPGIDEVAGLAAFASYDRFIYLVEAATGALLGRWETGSICYTTPLFARGKLFCGSGDRKLYVIDVATRKLVKTINAGARVYTSPVLVGDSVIFGTTGGKVFELDVESLEIVGAFQLSDAVSNAVAPSSDGRTLYVSTAMNALLCVERLSREGTST